MSEGLEARSDDLPPTFLDSDWSWSDPGSWPLSIKFLPVLPVLLGLYIAVYFQDVFGIIPESLLADVSCRGTFNYTFDILRVKNHAETLATHDWEIGTAGEALLELLSPEKAVFGSNPFPQGRIPSNFFTMDEALVYVSEKVQLTDGPTLVYNNYSVSDPAALGTAAVMIGQHRREWLEAAERQKDYLLKEAPRYVNGAISHRVEVAELWSDAIHMFPPFLAYYGVATNDVQLLKEAVRQIQLYREVLMIEDGPKKGLWRHIVGPSEKADDGAWSTGCGWVAYGIARVRATLAGWPKSAESMRALLALLDGYMEELLEAAMRTDDHTSGLLRNYLGDSNSFGEAAGTALLAAAAYRYIMFPGTGVVDSEGIAEWADQKRAAVFQRIDPDGVARPVVDSLNHDGREPFDGINPEAESFLLLLGAAWRDCVCSGKCQAVS